MSVGPPLLHEFLAANREDILARSRAKLMGRETPTPTASELADGLPLFLDQLMTILRSDGRIDSAGHLDVSAGATRHGATLLRMGVSIGQVVQDYGSLCQSVTELASERDVEISVEDFQTFNRCLDEAIAQAVTEYQRQRDRAVDKAGVAHLGTLAHELRNLLGTATLTFEALVRGDVGIHGSTGALLGRSLKQMRAVIDNSLTDVRLEAGIQIRERVAIADLIEEVAVGASLEAKALGLRLTVDSGPADLVVIADRQILAAALSNLVQNALKFTFPSGHIKIHGHLVADRVLVDVEDECGGLPPGLHENLFKPFEQHGANRKGLGLGLVTSLKGARACGGTIRARDVPGAGCVFTVDLPHSRASL